MLSNENLKFPQPEISPRPLSLFFTFFPQHRSGSLSSKGSALPPRSIQLSFPSSYPEHIIHLSASLGTLSILLCVHSRFRCLCPIPQRPQLPITESHICLCYLGTTTVLHTALSSPFPLVLLLRSCKQAPCHAGTPGPEHTAEARWRRRGAS